MRDHENNTQNILNAPNPLKNKAVSATNGGGENSNGLQAVIQLDSFRNLWLGQIFSQLADKFYIVFMVYILDSNLIKINTQSPGLFTDMADAIQLDTGPSDPLINILVTGIFVANTIPAMLLGTLAGVWADRLPKRQVMVASNALRALLVLLAPLCVLDGPNWLGLGWAYWALLGMTFLESVLTQFFAPAEQATIPLLVPPNNLLAANSIYQATSMGATIVGFAIGFPILMLLHTGFPSVLINNTKVGGEFLLLPLCYGIAAFCISNLRIRERRIKNPNTTFFMEIKEGLSVLKSKPKVRRAMMQLVLLYSLLAALYVLSIPIASSLELLGRKGFGTLLAVCGLGMALGAVVIAQIGYSFSRKSLAISGLFAITCSLVLIGQSTKTNSLWFTLTLCGVLGIGAALLAIPAQTTLQEETPEEQRGKVFGLQNNLINISLSLPLVLAGALVSHYGLMAVIWVLAGITLIAALLEYPWKRC